MTIWRMRIARSITKATTTHSEQAYVIVTSFQFQKRLQERATMLRMYAHCKSC